MNKKSDIINTHINSKNQKEDNKSLILFNTISILIIVSTIILWIIIIGANKTKTSQEKYIDDNIQMEALRKKGK